MQPGARDANLAPMRPQYRLAVASLCCDLALYLIMLSLPYRALDLGASSFVLGLVPLTYAGPYSLTAATAGWSRGNCRAAAGSGTPWLSHTR